jgi:hypothetical protein
MLPKRIPTRAGIDGLLKVEKSRQNASGVRLHDGDGLFEGEAGDRMRRVFSNAREPLHLLD